MADALVLPGLVAAGAHPETPITAFRIRPAPPTLSLFAGVAGETYDPPVGGWIIDRRWRFQGPDDIRTAGASPDEISRDRRTAWTPIPPTPPKTSGCSLMAR